MKFNKNYGKLDGSNVVKFAPSEKSDKELLEEGWLPIIDTESNLQNDPEYVYIAIGWEEVNGYIQKKY